MITQCPSCETRFVVSEEQLKVANGNVRCGSCMKVFFAADHQLGDNNQSSDATETSESTLEPTAKFSSAVYAQAGAEADYKETEAEKNIDAMLGLDEGPTDTQSTATSSYDGSDATHDWLNKLLPDEHAQQQTEASTEPLKEQAQAADNSDSATADIDMDPPAEAEPDTASSAAASRETVIASVSNDAVERIYEDGRIEPSINSGERFNPLNRIDSQPVELNIEKVNAADWLKKFAGALLCAALLAIFFAQWMLNNPADFRQHPQFGGAYEWVCEISGCETKNANARAAAIYQAQSTLVYSHPDQDNALIVESLILNQSGKAQPFPDIELEFTDHQGAAKASRRFTPAEYLKGELIGATQMPAATPVQIALEIADPGSDAVNYKLRLISAP